MVVGSSPPVRVVLQSASGRLLSGFFLFLFASLSHASGAFLSLPIEPPGATRLVRHFAASARFCALCASLRRVTPASVCLVSAGLSSHLPGLAVLGPPSGLAAPFSPSGVPPLPFGRYTSGHYGRPLVPACFPRVVLWPPPGPCVWILCRPLSSPGALGPAPRPRPPCFPRPRPYPLPLPRPRRGPATHIFPVRFKENTFDNNYIIYT